MRKIIATCLAAALVVVACAPAVYENSIVRAESGVSQTQEIGLVCGLVGAVVTGIIGAIVSLVIGIVAGVSTGLILYAAVSAFVKYPINLIVDAIIALLTAGFGTFLAPFIWGVTEVITILVTIAFGIPGCIISFVLPCLLSALCSIGLFVIGFSVDICLWVAIGMCLMLAIMCIVGILLLLGLCAVVVIGIVVLVLAVVGVMFMCVIQLLPIVIGLCTSVLSGVVGAASSAVPAVIKAGSDLGQTAAKATEARIPQARTNSWKTYNDPQGMYSMEYPADWTSYEREGMVGFVAPNNVDVGCAVLEVAPNTGTPGEIASDSASGGTRTMWVCGERYMAAVLFYAPEGDFDYMNRKYFEPMVQGIEVK